MSRKSSQHCEEHPEDRLFTILDQVIRIQQLQAFVTIKTFSTSQSIRTHNRRASLSRVSTFSREPQVRQIGKIRHNRSPDLQISIRELKQYINMLQLEISHQRSKHSHLKQLLKMQRT